MMEQEDTHARVYVQDDRSTPASDQSLATLISGLIADVQHLVRKEIELAKHELSVEVNKAKQTAVFLGAGAALGALGGLLMVLMLVHLLAEFFGLSMWVSYLIVGSIFLLPAGVLLALAINRAQQLDPVPRETLDTLREDVTWMKEQTSSGER